MKKLAPITAIPVALLALTACGQSAEVNLDDLTQAQKQELGEEFITRTFLDCEDGEETEDCEDRHEEETAADIDASIEELEEGASDAWGAGGDDEASAGHENDPARMSDEPFSYGQSAAYRDPDTGQEVGTFSVQYIDNEYDCDGSTALAVSVRVNTLGGTEDVTLTAEDFYVVDDNGEFMGGVQAPGCETTLDVPADSEGEELLVFDVDTSVGVVSLDSEHSNSFWEF